MLLHRTGGGCRDISVRGGGRRESRGGVTREGGGRKKSRDRDEGEKREGGGRAGTETVERGWREEEEPEQRLDGGAERQINNQRDNQDNPKIT